MVELRLRRFTLLVVAALGIAACRGDMPATLEHGVADADSPPDLVALLAELLPRVERLSGLDRIDMLRMRRQGRDDARRYVEARLDSEMPPERLDGLRRTYVMLGLLPDTLELRALLLDLYTEQVLGYYDPGTKTLYVVEGEDAAGLRPLLAHELVHALQDQHVDIDSIVAWRRGNDRQTAAHAAIEGHAMVVMFAVLAEEATRRSVDPVSLPDPSTELADALRAQNEEFPVFARAPAIIRETLLFPYVSGPSFVHQLWSSMAPRDRYPAPIDSLLPQSTAHVMQPTRFIDARREPLELRFPAAPRGWDIVYENTLGMLETSILLGERGGTAARAAASGWAGDRLLLVSRADGAQALHWISVWEDDAAAARFAAALVAASAENGWTITTETFEGHSAVRALITTAGVTSAAAGHASATLRQAP
jgi:hypothetical protein